MKPLARVFALLVLAFCSALKAATPSPFDAVHVYLITIGPGDEVYEKFGHNMIRVVGPAAAMGQEQDIDIAFNWGEFSFEQPHFIWHFIQGRMLYSSGAHYFTDIVMGYKQDDRSMWQQQLNLTAEQKQRLWSSLLESIDESHRNYRYDYYRDNCSTRTRDALDQALDGQIRAQLNSIATDTTFRWHTRRLMQSNFWLYTGLQYVLGHPVDQKITAWQECFLPVRMMDRMNRIKITDATGQTVPLVMNQQRIYQSKEFVDSDAPPHWIWIYSAIGVALAMLFIIPTLWKMRWWSKLTWGLLAFAWTLLGGVAAAILIFGEFFTDHIVTFHNENMLQLSPLMIPLIVLIPFAAWGKRWAVLSALVLAGLQVAANIAGVALKLSPAFYQPNLEIIALALPANIGMATGLVLIYRRIQSTRHAQ
ncbi:MAG TPA: DUF4105 domain-containing protein [Tepidisphaeraceae bacterium]